MNWIKSFTLFAVLLTAAALRADEATNQFNAAKAAFDIPEYESARAGFENFLLRFPTHVQAPAATFFLAESLMHLRQYPQAENYFNRVVALGQNDAFYRAAFFRLAEIPYLQGQFDIAKPRLEAFIEKFEKDPNLQFVLYYLGDIAMRSSAPIAAEEAEWYFGQSVHIFPEGVRINDSQFGLAWAKNKLGKITEADAIYAQLMNSPNPSVVERAFYQRGVALFERGAFQDAINALNDFQRRYPVTSPYHADSQRVIARCNVRLNNFEEALRILSLLPERTAEDMLLQVRCLYGLKRFQDAQSILAQVKQISGTLYRDEIALLEAVFLYDQKNWHGAIALLEQVLNPLFDPSTNRMTVSYLTIPAETRMKRLSEENFFRACSILVLSYAQSGDPVKANALLTEIQTQGNLSGNLRLIAIATDTANQLASIGTVPNRNNQFANRNEQWTPNAGQNTGNRPQAPLEQGSDLTKFWNAERLYRARNFEAAAQQLEQILNGFYNQLSTPPQYIIFYNITGEEGKLNEQTFARACALLALSKAQLGDIEEADAILATLSTRIRMSDPIQSELLRDTHSQVATIARGGGNNTNTAPASLLSDSEQRRLLREANSRFRGADYRQADERLTELIAANPAETILTEALLLQGKTKYQLGRERDGVALLERIVDEFPNAPHAAEALWFLGLYHETGGDSFAAVEYFQTLADNFQNFKHIDGALYFLAVDDLNNGSGRTAARYLTQIHRNHRNGLYWSHAAWTLAHEAYKKKQYAEAERYIQEILRHPPDIAILDRVLYLQGELALRRDDYATAFLAFREVGNRVPDSPLAHHATQNARLAATKVNVL